MSQKWFNGLNLQQNQLENAVIQNLASDPSSGKAGQIYYNTTDNGYRYHNGTAWVSITAEAVKSIVAGNGLTSSGTDTVTISLGTPSASGSGSNTYGSNGVTANSHTHQISLPDATDSAKGVIELATDAEATAGTDTTRAINAKQLAAAKQDAINSAKVTIQTSDGLTGGSSTPATSFTLGLSNSGVKAGTYNNVTVDTKGRVTAGSSQEYATKTYVDTQDDKKLDKTGGTITGPLTIGGDLTVNGTTTTVNSNTLTVKDKLIEVAKDNTTTLTSPAGIIVPKYNGTDYGALVIDGEGNAKVGDVQLTAGGDIDVNNSDLQTLATRTGLQDGQLVKWDDTRKTLVPDTTVASNASSALSKANANTTEITNIKNGTTSVGKADSADKLTTARTISLSGDATGSTTFDGSANKEISVTLSNTGVTAGTYNTVTVDAKGRVTAATNTQNSQVTEITGDGVKTVFDIAHTLGKDVLVQVFLNGQQVGADTVDELVSVDVYTANNKVKLVFATAPKTTEKFKIVISSGGSGGGNGSGNSTNEWITAPIDTVLDFNTHYTIMVDLGLFPPVPTMIYAPASGNDTLIGALPYYTVGGPETDFDGNLESYGLTHMDIEIQTVKDNNTLRGFKLKGVRITEIKFTTLGGAATGTYSSALFADAGVTSFQYKKG
jgi:phage-related tail fiber protein